MKLNKKKAFNLIVRKIKKAMKEKAVDSNPKLAVISGVSVDIVRRLMNQERYNIQHQDLLSIYASLDIE